jgi:hypothetical protein
MPGYLNEPPVLGPAEEEAVTALRALWRDLNRLTVTADHAHRLIEATGRDVDGCVPDRLDDLIGLVEDQIVALGGVMLRGRD